MGHKMSGISSSGPHSRYWKFSLCSYCCHLLFCSDYGERVQREGQKPAHSYLTPRVSLPCTDNAAFPSSWQHPGVWMLLFCFYFVYCSLQNACMYLTWLLFFVLWNEAKHAAVLKSWISITILHTTLTKKGPGSPTIPQAPPCRAPRSCSVTPQFSMHMECQNT